METRKNLRTLHVVNGSTARGEQKHKRVHRGIHDSSPVENLPICSHLRETLKKDGLRHCDLYSRVSWHATAGDFPRLQSAFSSFADDSLTFPVRLKFPATSLFFGLVDTS